MFEWGLNIFLFVLCLWAGFRVYRGVKLKNTNEVLSHFIIFTLGAGINGAMALSWVMGFGFSYLIIKEVANSLMIGVFIIGMAIGFSGGLMVKVFEGHLLKDGKILQLIKVYAIALVIESVFLPFFVVYGLYPHGIDISNMPVVFMLAVIANFIIIHSSALKTIESPGLFDEVKRLIKEHIWLG